MPEEKKPSSKGSNIVKKVFERRDSGSNISTLFTYTKQTPKVLPGQELKAAKEGPAAPSFSPLPPAIDFGSSGVKLLQLGREPKGQVEISLMDEEPYEKAPGRELAQQQKEALQKILLRNSVGPSAVLALSSKEVLVYNFVFPVMPDAELEEAVRWKIKQARPFDMDIEKVKYGLVRWSTRPSAPGAASQMRILAVCTPMDAVAKKIEMLAQAGLKTLALEVAPVGLVNLKKFRPAGFAADETALWLDLGAEESTITVERGGTALFFRNLGVTSRQLTRQMMQLLRVDEARAEDLKRRHGIVYWSAEKEASGALAEEKEAKKDDESAQVYYGLVSLLENLVIDVEHSFKYFSYQVTQSQIAKFDRVILAGGGGQLRGLDRFLSARLGVPVDVLNPLTGLRVRDRVKAEKSALLTNPGSFSTPIGLALGAVIPKSARLDLLAVQRRLTWDAMMKESRKSPKKAALAAACALLLLVGPQAGRTFYFKIQADGAEKKVKLAKSELSRLQTSQLQTAEEESRLEDKRRLLETKLQVLRDSSQGGKQFSEILARLAKLLPDEVWITKLTYNEQKMTLVGLTLKNELIVNFMEQLSQSEHFRDVTFNYSQKEANAKTYRFEVVMNVR